MNTLKPVLARLAAGERLAESEAEAAFGIIMAGEATPAQIAGLLMAMRVRGETVAELTGAVRAMRARMLADDWGVAAETWSVTSWNELARDGVATEEWNFLHPGEEPRTPYVTAKLREAQGPFVAVSDYMRAVPDQLAKWVPGDYHVLGTDGFGFADTRAAARRFFHIDAESVVVQALEALARRGEVKPEVAQEAFARYRVDDPTAVRGVAQEGGDA